MSLARALTTRRAKQPPTDMRSIPQRSNTSAKGSAKGLARSSSIRHMISGPMELTHTTNVLAYNAPDLFPHAEYSPTSSTKSDNDSLGSPRSSDSSPPTSPDMPSANDRSVSPEPNHLSCYFMAPGQQSPPRPNDAPSVPRRAPSHTKKASLDNMANRYARLSNQSSQTVSTKASYSLSRSSSTSTTATSVSSGSRSQKLSMASSPSGPSATSPLASRPSFRRPAEQLEMQHPFGHELAQVSELAEELGVKDKFQAIDEEEQQLLAKGLYQFRAEDYLTEIKGLLSTFLTPEPVELQAVWI
ncbi:Uu.00g043000.m01.CDS01 [Anthostomella pinea]|uniref:Uu.00g043000.m01.CDS01 n=1 Tax=Anthostomella pinea TaxID=933095 RepID=A0AAI8VBD5_9PEZI|nr:Uu.00g043000.m01.CDS01 [Anthostomella pinea]